jgi:hypothetical protein
LKNNDLRALVPKVIIFYLVEINKFEERRTWPSGLRQWIVDPPRAGSIPVVRPSKINLN